MILDEDDYLAHYGTLRRSGRYPWGSGESDDTFNRNLLQTVTDLRKQGMSEVEIARGFELTVTQLRALKTIAKNQVKQADINLAHRLREKGWSYSAIAERMNLAGESSARALCAPGEKEKADVITNVADMLKGQVDEKTYLDIGSGVENYIGVSKEKLGVAVAILEEQGYSKVTLNTPQVGTGLDTKMKVLVPPGYTQRDAFMNRDKIQQIREFSDDGGKTKYGIHEPLSINPKRVGVRYAEDGGAKADGVIYVRPGVKDVSLDGSRYAQVRIKVGEDHYLKGMAMYKDDLPPGVDLVFNTNKSDTGNKLDAMKPFKKDTEGKVDPDNPFGSIIERQVIGNKGKPNEKVTSVMNIVNEEGNWGQWSKTLSAQMLSKQPPTLAKAQLDKTFEQRKKDFDEIQALTNPTVKRKLLEKFADETDSAAVHLKAAALKGQASHVILPIDSMPPGQVYAPNYKNGESVVLIRYPHGGTFEIPELTVNNRQPEAKRLLGAARDAIGIHSSVAERLSGADFDGDTVLVIPNNSRKVKHSPALEKLKDFDPRLEYPEYPGMAKITGARKQREMGDVSNLITDMTIQGASHDKIARAVKHSMVVIDAEKHNLNYKQSAIDNGIKKLKEEYQGGPRAGAATLISRKKSEIHVPERTPRRMSRGGPINPRTGEKEWDYTGRKRVNAKGELVDRTKRSSKLAEVKDANELVSAAATPMERLYANHSNRLKAMANEARLASLNTPKTKWSSSAKQTYKKEVSSLDTKLAIAVGARPLERQAQVFAGAVIREKMRANPNMDSDQKKKVKFQALAAARKRTGAEEKTVIVIEPKEWDAIQAGAISENKLNQILNRADLDTIRSFATPRPKLKVSSAKAQRAKALLAGGATRAEVAAQLGISLTTLDEALNQEGAYE